VSTVKGSRNMQGFADQSGMTRFWSEEKPMGTGDELFRVKVVGSIPTDPTIFSFATTGEGETTFVLSIKKGSVLRVNGFKNMKI
jgi:hypothetical protein